MKPSEEQMVAKEKAESAELERRDSNISIEPEGESHASCVTTCAEWPVNSTHARVNTLDNDGLNRRAMSISTPDIPFTRPFPTNNAGLLVEELTERNYKNLSSAFISYPNARGEINYQQQGPLRCLNQLEGVRRTRNCDEDLMCQDKCEMPHGSSEHIPQTSFGLQELNMLSTKQNSKDRNETSYDLADNSKNVLSSKRPLLDDNQFKILSSSTQIFVKRSLKDKCVLSKAPKVWAESHTTAMSLGNNKYGYLNWKASDTLCNPTATAMPPPSTIDVVETNSFHNGISLRKWLKLRGAKMNKNERLNLFRQIVHLVNNAHSQGIALQELQPSFFVLLSSGVQYTGSSTRIASMDTVNQDVTKKRALEMEKHLHSELSIKQKKLYGGVKSTRHHPQSISRHIVNNETVNSVCGPHDYYTERKAQNCPGSQGTSIQTQSGMESDISRLEKKWYTCPEELNDKGLFLSNIYSLGVLLFELLCHFESLEKHSVAMLDLHQWVLPSDFLSENPKEASFCLWLLHPDPYLRPMTRDILQSELICASEEVCPRDDQPSGTDNERDAESEILLYFLLSSMQKKQNSASNLQENIECLENDIKELERMHEDVLGTSSGWMTKNLTDARQGNHLRAGNIGVLHKSFSTSNMLEGKLMKNFGQLEKAYFSMRSQMQQTTDKERSDKDLLRNRDNWIQVEEPNMEETPVDQCGAFFDGICKFARYTKFEVCGTLENGDLLNSTNVICSLSFDRDEDYIAAAGVSKKIKIFEFGSLLNNSVDIRYPVIEMPNKSKLSCVRWNNYIRNYLASTDYDGIVQMWDASTGQVFAQYAEHQKRAWSVDFSRVDPTKFASGSDDGSVKLWSINEKNSLETIGNLANICCVEFSDYSSHLLAFGSADYKIYFYDLRNTRVPWCTLGGHGKAISYAKFLDSETLISASTDNTLKLWDLKKTNLEGLSLDACSLTFTGHTNEKNFVGLSASDGYIACGSETNEVYSYHRSLPVPITSYKFESIDSVSGHEIGDSNRQFVSSVCWRKKSNMVVAANSNGSMKLLRMV